MSSASRNAYGDPLPASHPVTYRLYMRTGYQALDIETRVQVYHYCEPTKKPEKVIQTNVEELLNDSDDDDSGKKDSSSLQTETPNGEAVLKSTEFREKLFLEGNESLLRYCAEHQIMRYSGDIVKNKYVVVSRALSV